MTKFEQLQEKILLANREELKHTLGYNNDDAFTKTIEHITKANSLSELLFVQRSDGYLYNYNECDFLSAIHNRVSIAKIQ